jgi:tetratricopeptide (TPR) repeat protein
MDQGKILESWKEIAAHLHRNVRTCQIWEQEMGLPIHRLDGSPKARVFAYPDELDRWIDEKLHEQEIPSLSKLKKFVIPAAAVLCAATIYLLVRPGKKVTPTAPPRPSLAITYFENISEDESLEIWRTGIPELLIRGLSQSRLMRILRRDEIDDILKGLRLQQAPRYSMSQMKDIAMKGKVDTVLCGSFLKSKDGIEITAYLINPRTSATLQPISIKASDEADMIVKTDDLIREIKVSLGIDPASIVGDAGKSAGQINTRSAEAFRLLNEARNSFSRMEFVKSKELARRATEIDPEYALAYGWLGWSQQRLGEYRGFEKNMEKQLSLSSRLSEWDRLGAEGNYYGQWEETYDRALRAYTKILKLDPDDIRAYANIQSIYLSLEEWNEVILFTQEYLKRGGMHAYPHSNLAWAYMAIGNYGEARKLYANYLEHDPGHPGMLANVAESHLFEGRYDQALAELEKLPAGHERSDPDVVYLAARSFALKGDYGAALEKCAELKDMVPLTDYLSETNNIALEQGKFALAVDRFKEVIGSEEKSGEAKKEADARLKLAAIYLRIGKYEGALHESARALKISIDIRRAQSRRKALAYQGMAYLGLGQLKAARETAEELDRVIKAGPNKKAKRLYYRLFGLIDLGQKRYAQALDSFKAAVALLPYQSAPHPHAEFHEPLARAYFESGDLARAEEEYIRITLLSVGRLECGDIYAKAFFMLGRIAERQGDGDRARRSYSRFLDLWKDADPGTPEVEEAKKRLAALEAGSGSGSASASK